MDIADLIQIKAFGLNRMDILQREGNYPLPPGAPSIMGVEFSGHVVGVGDGVTEWAEGDEVLGLASGVSDPGTPHWHQLERKLTVANLPYRAHMLSTSSRRTAT